MRLVHVLTVLLLPCIVAGGWVLASPSQRPRATLTTGESFGMMALSPNGRALVTEDYVHIWHDGPLRLWNTGWGTERSRLAEVSDYVYDLRFSPDGSFVAAVTSDDSGTHLKVWDVTTGKERADLKAVPHFSVHFSPDSRFLLFEIPVEGNPPR